MKYTCEVTIDQPIARVVELFDNQANMKHWQPGLQSIEPISGTPGQPGARSRLKYDMNGRKIEMIETITRRNLPSDFVGQYEAKGVYNIVHNHFTSLGPNQTKWTLETEFDFSGFMKLVGWFMPGAFRKQSQQMMNNFKQFAETGKPVARS